MDCGKVREELLEALDAPGETRPEIGAHLAGCPACAEFAARQQALDARLGAALRPPEWSPAFRQELRRRIRREPLRAWPEWIPDAVHFASCGLAVAAAAVLLPVPPARTLAGGVAATVAAYLAMAAMRSMLEDAVEDAQDL